MARRLRVAIACNRFAPSIGGVQMHVERLAGHLVRDGHEVTVLTHRLHRSDPSAEDRDGVSVRRFAPAIRSEHLMTSPSLGRHLARSGDRYDLVHAHGFHDSPAAIATMVWDGPLVFTPHFHGTSASPLRAMLHVPYRTVGRRIMRRAEAIICVSPSEERAVLAAFPSASFKTRVISNGVDLERFRSAPRRIRGDARRTIAVVGRLEAYKRVDRMIRAMVDLRRDFVLEVCGDGPDRSRLEALAGHLGVDADVRFLGRVEDTEVASCVASAALLVSMSEHEAQGIALLEALAAGVPVLASDIPAHRDVASMVESGVKLLEEDAPDSTVATMARTVATVLRPTALVPSWADVAVATSMTYERALAADERGVGSALGTHP